MAESRADLRYSPLCKNLTEVVCFPYEQDSRNDVPVKQLVSIIDHYIKTNDTRPNNQLLSANIKTQGLDRGEFSGTGEEIDGDSGEEDVPEPMGDF